MLQQQTNVVLYHRLRDERLKHHVVHALLLQTCSGDRDVCIMGLGSVMTQGSVLLRYT